MHIAAEDLQCSDAQFAEDEGEEEESLPSTGRLPKEAWTELHEEEEKGEAEKFSPGKKFMQVMRGF